jgi:hypothetical protein
MFQFLLKTLFGNAKFGHNYPPSSLPPQPPKGQNVVQPLDAPREIRCGNNEVPSKPKPYNPPTGVKH